MGDSQWIFKGYKGSKYDKLVWVISEWLLD